MSKSQQQIPAAGGALALAAEAWCDKFYHEINFTDLTLAEEFVLLWQDQQSGKLEQWSADAFHTCVLVSCLSELFCRERLSFRRDEKGKYVLDIQSAKNTGISHVDFVFSDVRAACKTETFINFRKYITSRFGSDKATVETLKSLVRQNIVKERKTSRAFFFSKTSYPTADTELEEAIKGRLQVSIFNNAGSLSDKHDLALIGLCCLADRHGGTFQGVMFPHIFGKLSVEQTGEAKKIIDQLMQQCQFQRSNKNLTARDVEMLLKSLPLEDQQKLSGEEFEKACAVTFKKVDVDQSGGLDGDELSAAALDMFPAKHRPKIEVSDNINRTDKVQLNCPGNMRATDLIIAFDKNKNGRVDIEEFPDFVRFCMAWRLAEYFDTPCYNPLVEEEAFERVAPPMPYGSSRDII